MLLPLRLHLTQSRRLSNEEDGIFVVEEFGKTIAEIYSAIEARVTLVQSSYTSKYPVQFVIQYNAEYHYPASFVDGIDYSSLPVPKRPDGFGPVGFEITSFTVLPE
jgi:hypothetical protein